MARDIADKGLSSALHFAGRCGQVRHVVGATLLMSMLLTTWYVANIGNYHPLQRILSMATDNKSSGSRLSSEPAPGVAFTPVEGYYSYLDNTTLKLHCRTCAYVTGSGHMLGSKKGAEIDSMSCVFRSNDAPTKGYEVDVGTKTTLRTVDRNALRYVTAKVVRDRGAFDPHVVKSAIILAFSDPYSQLYQQMNKTHAALPQLRIYMISPTKYHEILKIFAERVSGNGVWASNGFISIYFAREVCDEIHVYGINEEKFCDEVRAANSTVKDVNYHYYGGNMKNCDFIKYLDGGKTKTHHFTKEKAFYRILMKEWGNIHFHAPEWMEYNETVKNETGVQEDSS